VWLLLHASAGPLSGERRLGNLCLVTTKSICDDAALSGVAALAMTSVVVELIAVKGTVSPTYLKPQ